MSHVKINLSFYWAAKVLWLSICISVRLIDGLEMCSGENMDNEECVNCEVRTLGTAPPHVKTNLTREDCHSHDYSNHIFIAMPSFAAIVRAKGGLENQLQSLDYEDDMSNVLIDMDLNNPLKITTEKPK
ncbi:hypothetical protein CHUAL_005492 [Chamberlinius hualienensis]